MPPVPQEHSTKSRRVLPIPQERSIQSSQVPKFYVYVLFTIAGRWPCEWGVVETELEAIQRVKEFNENNFNNILKLDDNPLNKNFWKNTVTKPWSYRKVEVKNVTKPLGSTFLVPKSKQSNLFGLNVSYTDYFVQDPSEVVRGILPGFLYPSGISTNYNYNEEVARI